MPTRLNSLSSAAAPLSPAAAPGAPSSGPSADVGGQRTPWSSLFQGAETQPLSSAPLPCRLIPRGQREARPSTPIAQMKAEAGGGEVGPALSLV